MKRSHDRRSPYLSGSRLLGSLLGASLLLACTTSDETTPVGGAGSSGQAGTTGQAGQGGASGSGGKSGISGQGGAAGQGGTGGGGKSGASGQAGQAGKSGGGASGSSGQGGGGGGSGMSGASGQAGQGVAGGSGVSAPILGEELVVNGGFENELTGWNNDGNTSTVSDAHAGAGAARIGVGAGGPSQLVKVVPGTTYRLSAFSKVEPGFGGSMFRAFYKLPDGSEVLHGLWPFSYSYQRLTKDFTVPEGVTSLYVSLWSNPGTAYAYLDDVSLRSVIPSSPVPVLVDEGDSISAVGHGPYYASSTADLAFYEHAVGGSGMADVEKRKQAVLDRKPKDGAPWVVTLLIGANDLGGGDPALYAERLFAYCDEMRAAGARCALSTVLPTTSVGHNQTRAKLNPLLRDAVPAHADAIIDYAADPLIGTDAAASELDYFSDGVHPTGIGQDRMFLVYKPVVDALLGKNP